MADFFGTEPQPIRLAGLRASSESIEEELRRACERLSKPQPEPPMVVSPKTFESWIEQGIVREHPPGSGNWWF